MVHIVLMGMNHKTAPVEVRERLAQACEQQVDPLLLRSQLQHVEEFFFLSTCNRVEFLFTTGDFQQAVEEVGHHLEAYLAGHLPGPPTDYFYIHEDLSAVRHLFQVASSLDSMVVGEPQILGQIKAAYREATQAKTVSVILNRLLHKSFSVAKRVRTETHIGSRAVSISYAAVELARKIFGQLADKSVLLVGAGEMAELAAEHFLAQGVRRMSITNRTLERAVELAKRFKAETVPFTHLVDAVCKTDIVLTSTGSSEAVVRYDDVKPLMRKRRNNPLFFIDIAVPRDVDPKVNQIDNVYLYDIDDLGGIVDLNRSERHKDAERAEHIIAEETIKFQDWLATLDVVPTIIGLRKKAESIRKNEVRKTLSHLPHLDDRERQAIDILTASIVRKLLHDPIIFLKNKSRRDSKQMYVDIAQQLFNLSDADEPAASSLDSAGDKC